MIKMNTNAQRIGLALTAFTAAWGATGFDGRPEAIIGALVAAIAGYLKPYEGKDTEA
jgi:hypothetical protein